MKRFSGICLITRNVPRLRQFYCDLLQVAAEGDQEYVTLATDEVDFSIVSARRMEQLAPGCLAEGGQGNYTLEFEVEDVEREYQHLLRLAIPIAKPPDVHPWGRRAVWFHDPEGNLVSFYTPVAGQQGLKYGHMRKKVDSRALVHQYFDRLLNQHDLAVCDELLAADYCDHDAPAETPLGPLGTKAYISSFLDTYPNLQVDIEKVVAEGNRVAARLIWNGTHATTGDPLCQVGVVIVRLNEQGKLAERWSTYMFL